VWPFFFNTLFFSIRRNTRVSVFLAFKRDHFLALFLSSVLASAWGFVLVGPSVRFLSERFCNFFPSLSFQVLEFRFLSINVKTKKNKINHNGCLNSWSFTMSWNKDFHHQIVDTILIKNKTYLIRICSANVRTI
jgi:hypothetical protein